jgi:AcrR family transcriptional regulator
MARIIKEDEYAARRKQILDVAQRYIYSKGYEQMSIQDILKELSISKGAFYHYFTSKQALLDGLIDQMWEEASSILMPILNDTSLPGATKLQRYFDTAIQWKLAKKEFVLALLRVWYADDNAIVRQKQQAAMLEKITPLIGRMIEQGTNEGSFVTAYPQQTAEVVINLLIGLGDTWARMLMRELPGSEIVARVTPLIKAYSVAMERVLGAASGSISFMDERLIAEWS